MKKWLSLLAAASLLTVTAAAGAETIYGTMQIPYADFYAAEGVSAPVDAVSSATNSKWCSESFASGAYTAAHANDQGGDILGVVYPVAIDNTDLAALGENNYGFTALEQTPAAYKTVNMANGIASFSAVQGEEYVVDAKVAMNTATVWGDYELDINAINNKNGTSDLGTINGALVKCADGSVYAMRHLENIWLDELSWSCGITTVEPHGNVMNSEMYADMMGKTITAVTFITESGYHTIPADLYVPVKFVGGVSVAEAAAKDGVAAVTFENLPEDYAVSASVVGLDTVLTDGTLTFTDALPGAYTLTVKDTNGKYADLTAAFVLTTDELPVAFDSDTCVLIAAAGADEDLAKAFIANISTVTVNDQSYAASGRGAVAIIDAECEVDMEAAVTQGKGADAVVTPIFTVGETYTITVNAAGFTTALTFEVTAK